MVCRKVTSVQISGGAGQEVVKACFVHFSLWLLLVSFMTLEVKNLTPRAKNWMGSKLNAECLCMVFCLVVSTYS
jgi:hypothetical protein